MKFIDLESQYNHLKVRINKRIQNVLAHGEYIMGPEVSELENKLAEYVGVKHAITCANGTDALTLCLMTLGIKQGDAVFCPTFTFFATAEVIAFAGAIPVFVDSNKHTFNICPKDLEEKIKQTIYEGKLNLKAIIAVDLFGLPADYPEIEKLAKKYNLKLIEDAAQGFGGSINGKKAGSFGDIATTSFFPAKPLGCYGDGGAVFTNNDKYAELIKSYRVHGKGQDKYDNIRIGVNSRLDTIQAAILLEKINVFPEEMNMRNNIASEYCNSLKDYFEIPTVTEGTISSWAQFTLKSNSREHIISYCNKNNIPVNIYYQNCMHQQAAFLGTTSCSEQNLNNAEELSRTVLSIPMHPYMNTIAINKVIKTLIDSQ